MKTMKTDDPMDSAWRNRVERARGDRAPTLDVNLLIASLRRLTPEPVMTLWDGLADLLNHRALLAGGLAASLLCVAGGGWSAYRTWSSVEPWIEIVSSVQGGGW